MIMINKKPIQVRQKQNQCR